MSGEFNAPAALSLEKAAFTHGIGSWLGPIKSIK